MTDLVQVYFEYPDKENALFRTYCFKEQYRSLQNRSASPILEIDTLEPETIMNFQSIVCTDVTINNIWVFQLGDRNKLMGYILIALDEKIKNLPALTINFILILCHTIKTRLKELIDLERLKIIQLHLMCENKRLMENALIPSGDIIVGSSDAIKMVMNFAGMVAATDVTILITGETGTGKELLARYIHRLSKRAKNRFVAVNCGALNRELLESELFGYKKGAFTGADRDKPGLFDAAHGGTIFLDEITEMDLSLQVKLLRVIQEKTLTPVGDVSEHPIDTRIIVATNKDIEECVRQGTFREDLYYRINVFRIEMPPLRDRIEDIPALVDYFIARFRKKFSKNVTGITERALSDLLNYRFPGNIRELQNIIERAFLFTPDGHPIDRESLHLFSLSKESFYKNGAMMVRYKKGRSLKSIMAELEKEIIIQALSEYKNNRTKTAEALGITRQALTMKLSKYGISGEG